MINVWTTIIRTADKDVDEMDLLKTGFIVVDTEDDTKGNPYLFGVYSKDGFYHCSNAIKLREYIKSRKEKYVICFNLQYDAVNIFPDNTVFNNFPFFIKTRLAKMIAEKKVWLCAYNHWNISIKAAGEIVGIKKLEVTDYTKRVSMKYLHNDVQIGYLFVEYMLRAYKHNGITYRLTIASTALHNFLNKTGVNPKIDKFSTDYFHGYFGGRVSCYRIGKFKAAYKYDINSAYAYAMAKYQYPYPLRVKNGCKIDMDGMTHCKVKSDMLIPILPYRDDRKNLYYPNGIFTGTWCNNELQYFQSQGGIILKQYSGFYFTRNAFIFSKYIREIYAMRLAAKSYSEKILFKMLCNALYGKFCQRGIEYKAVKLTDENIGKLEGTIFQDRIIIQNFSGYPEHCNVIWSAMITAYVRIMLHKACVLLGHDNILYSDTDSIITLKQLPENMIHSSRLGAFKFEGHENCEIIAPKVYKFGHDIKLKGVSAKAIAKAGNKIKKTYEIERPIKLFESLRRNLKANVWEKQIKTMNYKLSNCTVLSNGIVKPKILKG